MGPFGNNSNFGSNGFAMFGKLALGCGALVVIFAIVVGVAAMNAHNTEVDLRTRTEAQQQVCKADFDKMWKVIAQKAQVADRYQAAFREIYPQLIAGRYGSERGGALMSWITEANPDFDTSLYRDLSAAIEGQREGFFQNQKMLLDLQREHTRHLRSFPSSLVVGGRSEIEVDLIFSAATNQTYETGEENDVTLPGGSQQ